MKDQKNRLGLDIFDGLVLIVSLLGMIGFSYVLVDESLIKQYLQKTNSDVAVIGEAGEISNDVRRRMQRSLTWYSLDKQEPIYEGDSLFTGTGSSTEVVLNDGVNISIDENSLVYLSSLNDELILNLESGYVAANVKAKQKINLVQNGKLATISANNAGRIQIQKNTDGSIKLRSNSVSLNINSEIDNNTLDNKNQEINIDSNLKIEKRVYEIDLETPSLEQVILSEKINFKWNTMDQNFSEYKVSISTQPDFSTAISMSSNSNQIEWSLPETNRRYFWKVEAANNQAEAKSPVRWFYTSSNKGPKLEQPVDQLSLKLESNQQKKEILFSWLERYQAKAYEIQVAKDESFQNLLSSKLVKSVEFGPGTFAKGEYFWRVRAQFGSQNFSEWSNVYSFSVIEEMALPDVAFVEPPVEVTPDPSVHMGPPAPEKPAFETMSMQKPLAQSPSQHTLDFKEGASNREPQSLQKFVKNPPNLKWIKIKGAKSYQVEIAKDKVFNKVVAEPKVKTPKFTWTTARPGEYFWRVQALGEMGQIGPWSDVESFVVQAPTPKIKGQVERKKVKSISALNRPEQITVKWSEVPYASSYELEISDVKSGKVKKLKNKNNSFSLKMKSGQNYKVRVAALDEQGRSISSISDPVPMSVEKSLELNTPKPLLPQDGVTMVSFDDAPQPVLFKWSKVEGAKEYIFEISETKEFNKTLVNKKLSKTDYLQNESLPKKQLYWRVKAVYENYSSEYTKPRAFGF